MGRYAQIYVRTRPTRIAVAFVVFLLFARISEEETRSEKLLIDYRLDTNYALTNAIPFTQ